MKTTLDVRPLRDDLPFGSRVGGLTLEATSDPDVRHRVDELFEQRGLLVFEDMEPTAEMQVALSTIIGPLKDHPSQAVTFGCF